MNAKHYVLGSIAVFVFIYLAEFLFHSLIMSGSYEQHLELLRPEGDMTTYMPFMALGFLILAFGFCFVFTKGHEGKGIAGALIAAIYKPRTV